jgi:hypothetical protein
MKSRYVDIKRSQTTPDRSSDTTGLPYLVSLSCQKEVAMVERLAEAGYISDATESRPRPLVKISGAQNRSFIVFNTNITHRV